MTSHTVTHNNYILQIYYIFIQVSKVTDCELKRIGDLSFEFYWGACGTFKFPEERVMLCFAVTGKTTCERFSTTFLPQN